MAISAGVARNASCGPACGLIPLVSAIVRQVDAHAAKAQLARDFQAVAEHPYVFAEEFDCFSRSHRIERVGWNKIPFGVLNKDLLALAVENGGGLHAAFGDGLELIENPIL